MTLSGLLSLHRRNKLPPGLYSYQPIPGSAEYWVSDTTVKLIAERNEELRKKKMFMSISRYLELKRAIRGIISQQKQQKRFTIEEIRKALADFYYEK